MADALDALAAGLLQLFVWPTPAYLCAGVLVGYVVGVLPGLGTPAALALLLPVIIPLRPLDGFVLLTAVAAVSVSAGDITSILLGIPGEATAAAVVADGHALARSGQGGRAVGAALMASWFGAVIGAVVLALFAPIARPLLAAVGSPELAALAVLGICLLVPLSRAHPLKGLAAGALGLALAGIGLDPAAGEPRLTLGQVALWDGLGLLPVALGMFAVPEALSLLRKRKASGEPTSLRKYGVLDGCRDTLQRPGLVIRCGILGTAIGVLPGVGASVSQWVAYAHASQTSRGRERFGSGAIEGVIGPAAATTATLGGALVPTLALGIPGSIATAVLLGALTFKGLTPGPSMLVPEHAGGHLTLVSSLMWCIVVAGGAGALLGAASLGFVERFASVRPTRLFPALLTLVLIGTVGERSLTSDLVVVGLVGLLGYVMSALEWPRAPLVLGFVLGPLLERRLLLSINLYGWSWMLKPSVLLLTAGAVVFLAITIRTTRSTEERATSVEPNADLTFACALALLAAVGLWLSGSLSPGAALFPRLTCAITLVLCLAQAVAGWWGRPSDGRDVEQRTPHAFAHTAHLTWLCVFVASAWLLGLVLGSAVSAAAYSLVAARERWAHAFMVTLGVGAGTYVLVERIMQLPVRGVLLDWLGRCC